MKKPRETLFAQHVYADAMHAGAADYAREHNWRLRVMTPVSGPIWRYWRGDGILCSLDAGDDLSHFIQEFPGPKVDLTIYPQGKGFGQVGEDCEAIGRMAADYLGGFGFRHFLYVAPSARPHTTRVGEAFRTGTAAVASSFRTWFLSDISPDWTVLSNWVEKQLRKLPKPLAIYCASDSLAEWISLACLDGGLAIPEDVAVLGTGNVSFVCNQAQVPLSSIDTNHRLWGYRAAEMLDQMLDGRLSDQQMWLIPPARVVERQSTGAVPVDDVRVAHALAFLRKRFASSVSVGDVARAAGTSTPTLARLFRTHLSRSVGEELTRLRIAHAKQLLQESNLRGNRIAKLAGFNSPYYFYRQFKKQTGLSAKTFRQATTHHGKNSNFSRFCRTLPPV